MMTTKTTIQTTCSHCMADTRIILDANLEGVAMVGANSTPVFYEGGDEEETYSLIMWDCPSCEYADSYDRNYYAEFKPRLHRLLNEDSVFESQA